MANPRCGVACRTTKIAGSSHGKQRLRWRAVGCGTVRSRHQSSGSELRAVSETERESCSETWCGFVRGGMSMFVVSHIIWQLSCAVAAVGDMRVQPHPPPLRGSDSERRWWDASEPPQSDRIPRPRLACCRPPIAARSCACDAISEGRWRGGETELSGETYRDSARRGIIRWVCHGPPTARLCTRQRQLGRPR